MLSCNRKLWERNWAIQRKDEASFWYDWPRKPFLFYWHGILIYLRRDDLAPSIIFKWSMDKIQHLGVQNCNQSRWHQSQTSKLRWREGRHGRCHHTQEFGSIIDMPMPKQAKYKSLNWTGKQVHEQSSQTILHCCKEHNEVHKWYTTIHSPFSTRKRTQRAWISWLL